VVLEELTESAKERGIDLVSKLDRSIILNGDQTQLLRLVINLVSNAITHGRENGFVMVELQREPGKINLSVRDNGVGIAPENLAKSLIAFFRLILPDPEHCPAIPGSGFLW